MIERRKMEMGLVMMKKQDQQLCADCYKRKNYKRKAKMKQKCAERRGKRGRWWWFEEESSLDQGMTYIPRNQVTSDFPTLIATIHVRSCDWSCDFQDEFLRKNISKNHVTFPTLAQPQVT